MRTVAYRLSERHFSCRVACLQAKGPELERLRTKLKAIVRLLVREVWILIEQAEIDGKYVRTCYAQVHFHDDSYKTFAIIREKWQFKYIGFSSTFGGEPFPLNDLRKWRQRPRAILMPDLQTA